LESNKVILLCFPIIFIFLWVGIGIARSNAYLVNDDFFTFWLSAHLITEGENPYNQDVWVRFHHIYQATWIPEPIYLYPLPLAIVMAPLGWLPLKVAAAFWIFLSQIMTMASVLIWSSSWKVANKLPYLIPVLAGIFLFRPVIVTFRNGQLGAFLLLIMVGAAYLMDRGRWLEGGALLPLIGLKPSFGIPIILLTCAWLVTRKNVKGLVGLALSSLAILIIGWLYDSSWIQEFLWIGNIKLTTTFGYSPTVWGIMGFICRFKQDCTGVSGIFVSVLLVVAFLIILFRGDKQITPSYILAGIVTIALLITPYLWAYDQILLVLPILLLIEKMISRGLPYLITSTFVLGVSLFSLLLIVVAVTIGYDVFSGFVSFFILILLAVFGKDIKIPKESANVLNETRS
jgi:arabinofuranan 3-O-arabinosyltransferase